MSLSDHHNMVAQANKYGNVNMFVRIVVVFVCVISGDISSNAENLEERWRQEYPAAVSRITDSQRFEAKGSLSFQYFNGRQTRSSAFRVAALGEKRLIVQERRVIEENGTKKTGPDLVSCFRPESFFELKRADSSGAYLIAVHSTRVPKDEEVFNFEYCSVAQGATHYLGRSLLNRMQSPTFKLKAITSENVDGVDYVRIEYSQEDEACTESGSVTLEPGRAWAIHNVDITITTKSNLTSSVRTSMRYAKESIAPILPRHAEHVIVAMASGKIQRVVVDYSEMRSEGISDELFRLSAFGIPDVPLRATRPETIFSLRNPWFWGSLATTMISLFLLLFLRRRTEKPLLE